MININYVTNIKYYYGITSVYLGYNSFSYFNLKEYLHLSILKEVINFYSRLERAYVKQSSNKYYYFEIIANLK